MTKKETLVQYWKGSVRFWKGALVLDVVVYIVFNYIAINYIFVSLASKIGFALVYSIWMTFTFKFTYNGYKFAKSCLEKYSSDEYWQDKPWGMEIE